MDDDGTQRRSRRMDLNLYLGLPHSPCPVRPDLGSDLALSSLSMPGGRSTTASVAAELVDSHPPYSPSRAAYGPVVAVPAMDAAPLPIGESSSPSPEYTPCFPSYEPCGSSYSNIPPVAQEPLMDAVSLGEPAFREVQSHAQLGPVTPSGIVEGPMDLGDETDMPYSPPYVSPASAYSPPYVAASTTPETGDGVAFSFYPSPPMQIGEVLGSRNELRHPESHIRRLIDNHQQWARQFRPSIPRVAGSTNLALLVTPNLERPLHEIMNPQRLEECTGKEVLVEGAATREVILDEKGKGAAHFECNICLDMATEPVVTSCGHLFCWPCLHKWLHVHSHHKECPVCKGEVTEANITPIYGRGFSEASVEKQLGEEGESDVSIPPRPRGNRVESFRQQLRPISRRLGEGIASSWRRLLDQQLVRSRSRLEGNADPTLQEIVDASHRRALTRLRARRMRRQENANQDGGPSAGDNGLPRSSTLNSLGGNSSSVLQDGVDLWHRFSLYGLASTERLAALTADLGRVVGRFASISNHYGAASTSAINPAANSELPLNGPQVAAALAADQASASSTMAVIQDDVAISESQAEPNNAGSSSRSHRRRGRSSTGSLDVDGGALHARKRRRLN